MLKRLTVSDELWLRVNNPQWCTWSFEVAAE